MVRLDLHPTERADPPAGEKETRMRARLPLTGPNISMSVGRGQPITDGRDDGLATPPTSMSICRLEVNQRYVHVGEPLLQLSAWLPG